MDKQLQDKIAEIEQQLKTLSSEPLDYNLLDPVARMMLVALLHETEKIHDYIDGVGQKIIDKYCEHFIPRGEVEAMPAVAVVTPLFRKNKTDGVVALPADVTYTFKHTSPKDNISYMPLFMNLMVPYDDVYVITPNRLRIADNTYDVTAEQGNAIWIGLNTKAEIETLRNFSIFIKGISAAMPRRVWVYGTECRELAFSTMDRMEDIDMLEPFDAQQASTRFMALLKHFREQLVSLPGSMMFYITDMVNDRDVFRKVSYPKSFSNWLLSDMLERFDNNTVWLKIEYAEDYIVPDDISVVINAVPVANIDKNSKTLTQTTPVVKLQKQDDSFFVQVVETSSQAQKQGFASVEEEVIIRDFDASCYHDGDLYRDIRNLYNHFVEDYYAFMNYNGLKDGEDLRRLKELVNKIAKSVGQPNAKYMFDSGTYAMKNINQYPPSPATKVSFLTTQGARANTLPVTVGTERVSKLEGKKPIVMESVVPVLVGGRGGSDRANADTRYELLRYYSLTNDRLYTKMDIDAYVRKVLIEMFGKEEFKRIFIRIEVRGTAGNYCVERGLYIDIDFKDEKNYTRGVNEMLRDKLLLDISNRSCISLPVIITLNQMEK